MRTRLDCARLVLARLAASVVLFLAAFVPYSLADSAVGVRSLTAPAPARGANIQLMLWYPAKADGVIEDVGASKIFRGTQARRDASFADGVFPMVLLAHGGLRANPMAGNWIAGALAARGYIVVSVLPPQFGPDDAAIAVREIWLRPADLSAALTAVEKDASLAPHVAPQKVTALGFFLGGTAALAIVGGQLQAASYKASCDHPKGPDCRWFARSGVDLHGLDDQTLSQSHLDSRIGAAVAVDAELANNFAPESFDSTSARTYFVSLGDGQVARPEACVAGLCYGPVDGASAFSAFSLCTAQAAETLAAEGEDDSVCRDAGARSRMEIHVEIEKLIADVLAKDVLP